MQMAHGAPEAQNPALLISKYPPGVGFFLSRMLGDRMG